jgi:predicted dehydrogenase
MTINMIHLGAGARGRHWLDIVAWHPDFTSVACVDTNEAVLREVRMLPGQEHGRFFTSFEDALSQVQADAVLITSPSFLHASQALQALDAGLAVLVEKPLGLSLSTAEVVVERARAMGRPLMVAENYRFFPAERTVRAMLDAGVTGRVSSAVCIDRRHQPSHTQGPWVKSLEYPFLIEIAVHHFDSFRYLFNRQPSSIFAKSYNPPGSSYDQGAAAEALIELYGGFPIQYTGTMVASRYEYSLWIEAEAGDLCTDRKRVWWRATGRRFFRPVKRVPVPKGDELPYPKAGTVSLLNQFRDALLHGKVPETSGADNLWTLAMVEASLRSAREARTVSIDEVLTPTLQRAMGSSPDRRGGETVPPMRHACS